MGERLVFSMNRLLQDKLHCTTIATKVRPEKRPLALETPSASKMHDTADSSCQKCSQSLLGAFDLKIKIPWWSRLHTTLHEKVSSPANGSQS